MLKEKNVRLTISMPASTFSLLEEITEKNKRNKIITEAVETYIKKLKRKILRERLIKGYLYRADRDRTLAEEWI